MSALLGKAATLLLLLLLATPLLAAKPDRRVLEWESDIEKTKEWLRDGQYKKAERRISTTIGEVCNALIGGDEAGRMLGILLTLRAVAEAGIGEEHDAIWSWKLAQQFEPALMETDLSEFGPPGEMLSANKFEPLEELQDEEVVDISEEEANSEEDITPPIVRKSRVKFPQGALSERQDGQVQVMVVIDRSGKISDPRIMKSLPNPVMTLTAIEAMKTWRFKPARLNGEPVDVYYKLDVDYIAK